MGSKIKWDERYSSTMEDDEMGRWARVCYAGNFKDGFIDGKPSVFEIAWIKKLKIKDRIKFVISPQFPYTGKYSFLDLEEAKKEVESRFKFFIENCHPLN